MPIDNDRFQPVSGLESPRFAGVPTFMRLPLVDPAHADAAKVEIGIVGLPWDGGTTNRPGARHGPRQLRDLSTMVRWVHPVFGANPFRTANCADLGDVAVNPASLDDTLQRITAFYGRLMAAGIVPLTAGGDHLLSLPVLRAVARHRPLGMIHFDSHTDLNDSYFGDNKLTHGTPFRRAVEEGLLEPKRVVQIGIRGTMYGDEDLRFAERVGIRIIRIEDLRRRGPDDVMAEARAIVGSGPAYVSFDIDFIDPAFAPGTGTPEIGGPDTFTAQQCVRGLDGVDIVAADLVEVAPPFDPSGNTAWVGASIMFELLTMMARSLERRRSSKA